MLSGVGAVFDDHSTVEMGMIGFVRLFRVVRVDGVAVVRRSHHAGCQRDLVRFCRTPDSCTDPQQRILQQARICTLFGRTAHFLIVKHRTYWDRPGLFAVQQPLGARPCALKVVQARAGKELTLRTPGDKGTGPPTESVRGMPRQPARPAAKTGRARSPDRTAGAYPPADSAPPLH